jgi:flagellar hook assembly protein FlgD
MNTHTTFAFRVEGGTQQPEDFRLRIYTLSGRLIRAFRAADVNGGGGPRVGWNTLRWDGRDADGDRVATGVYLYRVVVRGENGTFMGDVEKVAVIR